MKYESVAIQIVANWPTISEGEKSFFCMTDALDDGTAKGGFCAEANISGTTYEVKSYSILDAQVSTKLTAAETYF